MFFSNPRTCIAAIGPELWHLSPFICAWVVYLPTAQLIRMAVGTTHYIKLTLVGQWISNLWTESTTLLRMIILKGWYIPWAQPSESEHAVSSLGQWNSSCHSSNHNIPQSLDTLHGYNRLRKRTESDFCSALTTSKTNSMASLLLISFVLTCSNELPIEGSSAQTRASILHRSQEPLLFFFQRLSLKAKAFLQAGSGRGWGLRTAPPM